MKLPLPPVVLNVDSEEDFQTNEELQLAVPKEESGTEARAGVPVKHGIVVQTSSSSSCGTDGFKQVGN